MGDLVTSTSKTISGGGSNKTLQSLHILAGLLHVGQAGVLGYLVSRDSGISWPLQNSAGWNEPTWDKKYKLAYLIPCFPFLSSFNHIVSVVLSPTYNKILKDKVNPLRWSEYSISAGIMLWIVASLSGILEVKTLIMICTLNVLLQYIGYKLEVAVSQNASSKEKRELLLIGFGIHLCIWLPILISFYSVISSSKNVDNRAPPDAVYSIIWVMFSLFTSFGVLASIWAFGGIKSFDLVEIGYLVLSFTSKSILTWMVYFGVLAGEERFETTAI